MPISLSLGLLSILIACEGDPTSSNTPETDAKRTASMDGRVEGESSSAVEVRSFRVKGDGSEEEFESAQVNADGSFSVEIDTVTNDGDRSDTNDFAIIRGFDADGQVVGAVLVEETGSENERIETTPMDAESTVEAMAWLQITQEYQDINSANHADIRGRVNADLAVAVYSETSSWEDGSEEMDRLSAGLDAALHTHLAAMAERGESSDARGMYEAQKEASLSLTTELYAMAEGADEEDVEQAEGRFMADINASLESDFGMNAEDRSEVYSQSSLALVTTLDVQGASSETWDSSVLLFGEAQAMLSAQATEERAMTEDWDSSAQAELQASLDAFVQDADQAEDDQDADAMTQVWADFRTEVSGQSQDTLVGFLLDLDVEALLALDAASEESEALAASLDAEVMAAAEGYKNDGDAQAMAEATVQAWADYESGVDSVSADLATELDGALDLKDSQAFFGTLFVQSSGSFTVMGSSDIQD